MTKKHDQEIEAPIETDASQKSRSKFISQSRSYLGVLTDEDMDTLSFEEEFDTFERLKTSPKTKKKRERR